MGRMVRAWVISSLVALSALPAHATDPRTRITQLGHTAWRVQDGVLNAAPNVIVQTKDGYLWVGTETGLLRFDGMRFVAFNAPGWEQIANTSVTALLAARDGTLWIGTPTALASWRNGKLTVLSVEGHSNAIVEDHQGRIWATFSRVRGQPLCQAWPGKARCYGPHDGVSIPFAGGLDVAKDGSLLVASADVVLDWSPERGLQSTHTFEELKRGENLHGISSVLANEDGSSLLSIGFAGKGLGLQRWKDGAVTTYTAPGFDGGSVEPSVVYRDRSGSLWIGTFSSGVFRVNDLGVEHFTSREGLSGDAIRDFREDREGDLWIATDGGMDCFRDLKIVTWGSPQGLPSGYVGSILATHDGSIWLGSHSGLSILRDGGVSTVARAQGLPGAAVTALLQDGAGRIWMGVSDHLAVYDGHRFTTVNGPDGQATGTVASLALDADGSVWANVLGQHSGLLHIEDGRATPAPSGAMAGHILLGDTRPGLWVEGKSQLGHYANGQLQKIPLETTPATKNGISPNDMVLAADGSLFASTAAGVWGVRGGEAHVLGMANGLPCQNANGLAFSAKQALLIRTTCGLLEIAPEAIRAWWADPQARVPYRLIDSFDGARLSAATFSPQMSRARDGRIWIANEGGIQVFDPDRIPMNAVLPPVHIEELIADRIQRPPGPGVVLPPLTWDIEIQYTALSFSAPQKVRFKYMLDGRDTAWQDPGTRRTAFYQDLKPGHYRFHVIAANNDGVWNSDGDSLDFNVKPAWFQTIWFRVLWIACLLLLAWALYRARVNYIAQAINARFNERLAERTRVARQLHDTFLQTVQGSKMVADDALVPGTDAARMRGALVKLSGWLEQATREAREALQSLRVSIVETNHLAESLRRAAEAVPGSENITITVSATGEPRDFHPIIRDEVFQISFEAVRNAIQHSAGKLIRVEIEYATNFLVTIMDDGIGLSTEMALAGRPGHFGLTGMRERASRLSGELAIKRTPAGGTIVQLSVPGSVAYHQQ